LAYRKGRDMSLAPKRDAAFTFAEHVLAVEYDHMPPSAIQAAKTFFLDTLGVGIAGSKAVHADRILAVAGSWGAPDGVPASHVWGGGARLPVASAAYVNGFQIHCQEYDCVHEPAVVHPLAAILAALLTEADARPVSGRDMIAALAGAVDVAAGIGVAVKSPIRFFRPANAGVFGATLGIARLRRFSLAQAMDALGYALAQCAGTMQSHVEGKPALPVQIAGAARAAIVACDLAQSGIPGPHNVLEGPFGYFPLFELEWELDPVVESLGKTWRIAEVSHKPFPTGRAAQGGIVLMQKLAAQGVGPDNLASLRLTAPPLIWRLVGRPIMDPLTPNFARLCFQYCGAVALARGTVGLDDFTAHALSDPAIHALGERISVVDDGTHNPAAFTPQTATALLHDGRKLTVTTDRLYGSPADPMSRQAQLEKFRACLAFGFGQPLDALADEMIARTDRLEDEPDAGAFARLASGQAYTDIRGKT
jgi:2-methylcitrate dehydratase PrpD